MQRLFLVFLFIAVEVVSPRAAAANTRDDDLVRKIPPVRISVVPHYQRWTHDGLRVSQLSVPIAARLHLWPNLGLGFRISQASAEGDDLHRLDGWTDAQVTLDYAVRLPDSHLTFSLGLNVPTGKSRLSNEAFETAFLLGLSQYNFYVPHFGQGVSLAPSIVWTKAVNEALVVGLGASMRFRGTFEPLEGLPEQYDWGNELLLTLGGEAKLARTLSLSADVIVTRYGADKLGEITVYEAGNQVTGRLQLHKSLLLHDLWLSAHYRRVASGRALVAGALRPEAVRAFPDVLALSLRYRLRLHPAFRASLQVEGARYDAALLADQRNPVSFRTGNLNVYSAGIAPEVSLGPALTIPLQVRYSFGDIEGLEAGLGLVMVL